MKNFRCALLCLVFAVAGCTLHTGASFIQSNNQIDDQVISSAVSDYLCESLPPGRSTLLIKPAAFGNSALLDLIRDDLSRHGFAIAEPNSGAVNAKIVRLIVTENFGGFVVRLDYGNQQAGTFFGRDSMGHLEIKSPFMHRLTMP
jgi:hypothetical protein